MRTSVARPLALVAKPFTKLGRALKSLATRALFVAKLGAAATALLVLLDALFTAGADGEKPS